MLELLPLISTRQVLLRQLEENEEIQNVFSYGVAVGQISRTRYVEYTSLALGNLGESLGEFFRAETNLMLISGCMRWIRIADETSVQEHLDDLLRCLRGALDCDRRLVHLIEATEALLECGLRDDARVFTEHCIREASQTRSIHRLDTWIVIFHKATYIERELKLHHFVRRLFSPMSQLQFEVMVTAENWS
jgi:hypothetical protein